MPAERQTATGIAGAMDHHPAGHQPGRCYVCGGPFRGDASYAARALPGVGVAQVCGPVCAEDARFARRLALEPVGRT